MTTPSATAETMAPAPAPAGPKREQQQSQQSQHVRQLNAAGCGGEGCIARDPWPVHHVRHRGNLCRLCTSCVLRYHPGSFCPKCFELVDPTGGRGSQLQPPPVVHCASCPSVCHTACLADPEKAASYVCPSCANPNGRSYFPVDCDGDGEVSSSPSKKARLSDGGGGEENPQADGRRRRTIDRESAKVLLAAARLASASMNRAVAFARSEAERKAKDAVIARKKAKEMLEKALVAAKREREKRQDVLAPTSTPELQRKASVKLDDAVVSAVAQKRKQNREREQWMKVEDSTPLAQKSPVRAITENERVKVPFPNSHLNHSPALTPTLQDNVKLDLIGKNGSLPASKNNFSAENKRGSPKVPVESGVGVRLPQAKQDASVTKTNPRVIFSGMPDKTSLH